MQRLSGLSRRYMRQRRGRTVLAGSGIALGVAVLFSSLITIASLNRGLDGMRMESPGMDVTVMPAVVGSDGALDDAAIERLKGLDGVGSSLRILDYWVALRAGNTTHTTNNQRLIGVDLAEVERFADGADDYALEPAEGRIFADGADEVMLSESWAEFLGVQPGDHVVATNLPTGERRLLLTGLFDSGSVLGRRNNGQLVSTSLSTARRLLGRPDGVSWAALHLEPRVDPDAWVDAHEHLDARVKLHGPGDTIVDDRAQLADLGAVFTVFGTLVTFVAGFLVFLTLSMTVAERQATLGVLRALGAPRSQLMRLVLVEALVVGTVATAVGLAAGYGLAWANVTYEPLGRTPFLPVGLPVSAGAVVASVGLGMGATVASALVPARRAGRMAPLDAIREPVGLADSSWRTWALGLVAFPAGLVLASRDPGNPLQTGVGLLVALAGAMLVVPAALPWLCRRLTGIAAAPRLRLAQVAIPHLSRERTRSAYTLGLAMVVMAMATAMAAAPASASRTGEAQIAAQVADTVQVHSGVIDEELVQRVSGVPGIAAATPLWLGRTEVAGPSGPIGYSVTALDPARHFDVSSFAWVAGSDRAVAERLARPGSVVVPEHLARRLDVSVDDPVTVTTVAGPREFLVAGIYISISPGNWGDGGNAVVIGWPDAKLFGLAWPATVVEARLEPSADLDTVTEAVRDLTGSVGVNRPEDRRFVFDRTVEGARNLVVAILVPAALVSALGLANTLAVAMLERRRELGLLRAIGLSRRQARSLAVIEAGVMMAVAAALAVPLGYVLSKPVVAVSGASFGTVLHYAYPWRWLAFVAAMALVLAVLAAIAPARRAARVDVSAALRFE